MIWYNRYKGAPRQSMRQGISQSMANITSVLSHRVMKTHFSLKGI
ncbi:hypothetical protein L282_2731 [Escherichia coli APEC IMT5155]|nr:hypothetical protein L282_2731 [Escherichia coli APEC IMT5155]